MSRISDNLALVPKHSQATKHGEINKTPPYIRTQLKKIPPYRFELLFLSDSVPQRCVCRPLLVSPKNSSEKALLNRRDLEKSQVGNAPIDPSTIYFHLPVMQPAGDEARLAYGPCYRCSLSPKQRGKYLNWLCDVEQTIEIGYVFLYYYGLERHLVFGNFDAAFEEILLLRKFHTHPSFLRYSERALLQGSLARDRRDKLKFILGELNYGSEEGPIDEHLISLYYNDKDRANISLPSEIRKVNIPIFRFCPPFVEELSGFFREVHERVKIKKRKLRKRD